MKAWEDQPLLPLSECPQYPLARLVSVAVSFGVVMSVRKALRVEPEMESDKVHVKSPRSTAS